MFYINNAHTGYLQLQSNQTLLKEVREIRNLSYDIDLVNIYGSSKLFHIFSDREYIGNIWLALLVIVLIKRKS